jgi:N-acetylglucosamine malate deacetylase 1
MEKKRRQIMNVLIIAAHPDDIELGMGGTLFKLTQKAETIICYHTTSGVYTDIYEKPVRNFSEILETTIKSMAILNLKPENILFNKSTNATDLLVNKKNISEIQKLIIKYKITDIYTHMEKDTYHQDHMATHLIAMAAARRYVNNIYCFESIFNYAEGLMVPNSYIDITDAIEKKCESLRCHKTEYDKFNGEEWIESVIAMAKYRGIQVGVKYAEAFNVKKQLRFV